MKKYAFAIYLAVIALFLLMICIFFVTPTNEQLGQPFWSNVPVIQKLEPHKSPAELEGPVPPAGISYQRWYSKFAYRLTGELDNFDEESYRANNPVDLIIYHKDGGITIYMVFSPQEKFIGKFRLGLPL